MRKRFGIGVVFLTGLLAAGCGRQSADTPETKTAGAGDAARGKALFAQYCLACHDPETTEKKLGPGLKGLYRNPKLVTTGKPVTDANVIEQMNQGGNGMTPFRDLLSDGEKADLTAYLRGL